MSAPRKNGTPLASKIVVVACLLGLFVAVVGSRIAPRGEQNYYLVAAVLIPVAFILGGKVIVFVRRVFRSRGP